MVRLKIAYWEFDFEAVCPTLDHDLLSQAHIYICVCVWVCILYYQGLLKTPNLYSHALEPQIHPWDFNYVCKI